MDVVSEFLNGKLKEEVFYAAASWLCTVRERRISL